ncbi:MAG TPA: hypothetical protein VJK30_02035 [Coxiellaceae bacterium]|nr:MAG: hypothetical protein A3E81_03915 [Gammaproteobacteria bacterium RIFCSPHIGHO2_12_FULL_36_30]HLB56100.1 hypothetical protein [Coxiellaceae bacterium]
MVAKFTGRHANFVNNISEARAVSAKPPTAADLKNQLTAARTLIAAEYNERAAKRPLSTSASQTKLVEYDNGTKKLNIILKEIDKLLNAPDKLAFNSQYRSLSPYKEMHALEQYFTISANAKTISEAHNALHDIIKNVKASGKKTDELLLTPLQTSLAELQTAQEELKNITDKMITPTAEAFYQEQYREALKKSDALLADIAAQLKSSETALNAIFADHKKSAELAALAAYLTAIDHTVRPLLGNASITRQKARPSEMPIMGRNDGSSTIKMDRDGKCVIEQWSKNAKGKWEKKPLLDKSGNTLRPTIAEIQAAIAAADKTEQQQCADAVPPKNFKKTSMEKDLFGDSYTIKHRTTERRDIYNEKLKEIVATRMTAKITPMITHANTTTPTAAPLGITHR